MDNTPTLNEIVNEAMENDDVFQRMTKEKEEVIAHSNEILANQIIPEGTLFGAYSNEVLEDFSQYTDIKMDSSTDSEGRQFFRFFDGKATSLVIVLFSHNRKQLVSVNQRVLPLQDFLNIVEMETVEKKKEAEVSSLDIRKGLAQHTDDVVVRVTHPTIHFGTKEYTFKHTSVPLLLKAMSHFSTMYNKDLKA